MTWNRLSLLSILATLADVGGALASATLRLGTNISAVNPDTAPAGFTEPTYTGYAGQAITWFEAVLDALGRPILQGESRMFSPSAGNTTSVTVDGWFITTGTGPTLKVWAYAKFPQPVALINDADGVVVQPFVQFGTLP